MKKLFSTLFFTAIVLATVVAQPGADDSTFNQGDIGFGHGSKFNGPVRSTVIQPDGKVITGGGFTTYDGTSRSMIARLNVDGSLDTTFNPGLGFDNSVLTIILQDDGKVIIVGDFTSFNGFAVNRITRLNVDGTLDTTFVTPGTGFNNSLSSATVQDDGKILVWGIFTSFNGITVNYFTRLNTDGSLDTSFDLGTGFNNKVHWAAIQNDGKIIVCGSFSSLNGINTNRITRLNTDGTTDASFSPPGTGFNSDISYVVIQSDQKIIASGSFTYFNGTPRKFIARLDSNGFLDTTFDPIKGPNVPIKSAVIQIDGKIIVFGQFISFNEIPRILIARLNSDGSLDVTFNPGTLFNSSDFIWTASIQTDGKVIIGGQFTSYINRLNSDGSNDSSYIIPGTGFNDVVRSTEIQADGKIIVGGAFTTYNGNYSKQISRLNPNGSLDSTFNSGTAFDNSYVSVSLQSDGKIIVVGGFKYYQGTQRKGIARINMDGSLDTTFNPGAGFNSFTWSSTIQSDGKIIVLGAFTSFDGVSRNNIARLNSDGSLDTSFDPGLGFNNWTYIAAIQDDGKIIVGGTFTSYDGNALVRIARLNVDGSLDISFNTGTGFNYSVSEIAIQSDGKIIAGGNFTMYNGTPVGMIVRLNTDASIDTTFNTGTGFLGTGWGSDVRSIKIQSDDKIIVGGGFTGFNGTARKSIARLNSNGSLDTSFDPLLGFDDIVWVTAIQSDGKIITGGSFTSLNGIGRNRIARLLNSAPITSIIENTNDKRLTIYPNPTSGSINLISEVQLNNARVRIINLTGQIIFEKENLNGNNFQFDLNKKARGVYFIEINEGDIIFRKKLIIN